MSVSLQTLRVWLAGRPRNEQLLIVACGAALFAFMCVRGIGGPVAAYTSTVRDAVTKQQAALADVRAKSSAMNPEELAKERRERLDKIATLQAQQAEQRALVETLRTGLVSKDEAGPLLAAIMRGHPGVTVTNLKSLPAEAIVADESDGKSSGETYYKHPLRLSVVGRYVALVRFADDLEKLQWKVFWSAMRIESGDDGESHATFELFTIGKDASWFTVG